MGTLSTGDLAKVASSGPFKGKKRKDIFKLKIKAKSPFLLEDDKKKITVVQGLEWNDKTNVLIAKLGSKKFNVTLRYIVKDIDFGGNPAKKEDTGEKSTTVGGKEVEVFSEAFFCYYFALFSENKMKEYSPQVWKTITNQQQLDAWTKKIGIYSYVETQNKDTAFTSRLNLAIPFLVVNGWHDRLVKQMEKFFSVVKPSNGKNYEAMRADEMPSDLNAQAVFEILAEKAKQKFGFTKKVDKDKWNPGDVWIFSTQGKQKLKSFIPKAKQQASSPAPYTAGVVAQINKMIYDLYLTKDLFPVSLKAPGSVVHISEENAVNSSITKVVRFIKVDLGPTNLDVKIHLAIDLYNEKTKKIVEKDYVVGYLKSKTIAGGFRLELEVPGSGARFGSFGTENQQWIVSNTDDSGIKKLQSFRKDFSHLAEGEKNSSNQIASLKDTKNYLSASNLQSTYKKNPKSMKDVKPYLDKLYKAINGQSSEFGKKELESVLNKTVASEIAVAIQFITNKLKRDITVENMYDLAASQRLSSGIRPEQLARRKAIYGKEAVALGPAEAQYVFEYCFYLKVY